MKVVEKLFGEEVGVKLVIFEVDGWFVYGYFFSEKGMYWFVR